MLQYYYNVDETTLCIDRALARNCFGDKCTDGNPPETEPYADLDTGISRRGCQQAGNLPGRTTRPLFWRVNTVDKKKGELDRILECLDSGGVKPRVREYVGFDNAIKNAKRKKIIIIMTARKRKHLASLEITD